MSSEAEAIEQSAGKAKHHITNWGEYDAVLVKRGSLTLWMDEKTVGDNWRPKATGKRGAPCQYSDLPFQTLLVLKAVYSLLYHALEGFARSLMQVMVIITSLCFYSSTILANDHGDDFGSSTLVSFGSITNGNLDSSVDIDYFKFTVSSAATYFIYTRGGTDTTGSLYNDVYQSIVTDYSDGEDNNFRIGYLLNPGTYYIEISGSIGNYALHLEGPNAGTVSDDHGFTPWSATPIGINCASNGRLDTSGDSDFFKILAPSTATYTFYTSGGTDTTGSLYNDVYQHLETDYSDGEDSNFSIEYLLNPGTYYIEISGNIGNYEFHNSNLSNSDNCLPISGRVDISSDITILPSPVTIGQNFDVSFTLKEYQGDSKEFEYVQLWIQDGSGHDLYMAKDWGAQNFSPNQQRSYSHTTFLDPAQGRIPGTYRAIVRGKIAGDDPFNFGVVPNSNGQNPKIFTAVTNSVPGRVDVNSGITLSPTSVSVGQNFDVSFTLKEYQGGNKEFEYIQLWIQDANGHDLYMAKDWGTQNFSLNQERSYSHTTFLDPARDRTPGTYRAIVRGRVLGDPTGPFNFGVVPNSNGQNPKIFTAAPVEINYLALGDSYSSGEGALGYLGETTDIAYDCHRSILAYSTASNRVPEYVLNEFGIDVNVERAFYACSGATTENVINGGDGQYDKPLTQLEILKNSQFEPNMVTVSIGGNDLRFADILRWCIFTDADGGCRYHRPWRHAEEEEDDITVEEYMNDLLPEVKELIETTINDIKNSVPQDTPIFLLGYPHLFPEDEAHQQCDELRGNFLSIEDQIFLRELANSLNQTLNSVANAKGIHFVPVINHFKGHEICGSKGAWVHALVAYPGDTLPANESFHPTQRGQLEYSKALNNYIREKIQAGAPSTPTGLPANPGVNPTLNTIKPFSDPLTEALPTIGNLSVTLIDTPMCDVRDNFALGQSVQIVGDGFTPNATVYISLSMPQQPNIDLGTTTADSSGEIRTTLMIPIGLENTFALMEAVGMGNNNQARLLTKNIGITQSYTDDSDTDGIPDICDNCPTTISTNQTDTDKDGFGDICDLYPHDANNDIDGDGISADIDTCPLDPDNDIDHDGACAELDNCPTITNPDQNDTNHNGVGDACDQGITFDIDGNGQADALTDGLLLLRYLFGFTGNSLIDGAVALDATRSTAADIESYLSNMGTVSDIDGNGQADALTDGLLVLRYLFGFTGNSLIDGAVAPNATRSTATEIENYISSYLP